MGPELILIAGMTLLCIGVGSLCFLMGYVRGELTAYRRVNKALRNPNLVLEPKESFRKKGLSPKFRRWQLNGLFDAGRIRR